MAGRVSVRSRGRLLAGSALGLATAAALTASPAAAVCLGENTATVTCNAANPATAGTLGTTFAGTTVVNIDNGAQIDSGGAVAIVSAAGDLIFNHNDLVFGITNLGTQGIGLGNDFGSITYVGNGAVTADGGPGVNAGIGAGAGTLTLTQNGTVTTTGANGVGVNGTHAGTGRIIIDGTGTITASTVGLRASHTGLGPAAGTNGVVIRGSGDVTGTGLNPGVFADITNAANASNILVDRTGAISGGTAVNVQTSGTGSIEVLVNGALTATNGFGVLAYQSNNAAGTNGGVHVGGAGSITKSGNVAPAIHAQTVGANNAGSVLVDYTGSITSTTGGILATANGGGNVTVIGTGNVVSGADPIFNTGIRAEASGGNGNVFVAPVGTISGNDQGIQATAVNLGTVTVTVINHVTGVDGRAIDAGAANGQVTVNLSAGLLLAASDGIAAQTSGSGAVVVNMTGGQIGTAANRVAARGIRAQSATGPVTIVANGTIYSSGDGVAAGSAGATSSAVSVTSTGLVDANASGISVVLTNAGATGGIAVLQSGSVRGSDHGIIVQHNGTGTIAVTVAGTVTGGAGFNGVGLVGAGNKTLVNTGTITGGTGVFLDLGTSTVTNAGAIIGTGGTALEFGGVNNLFIMQGPAATLTGTAGGSGTDTFRFAGAGSNTFDVGQIGAGWAALQKTDSSIWTLTGTATTAAPMTVSGGTLAVNGNTATFATNVDTGGTLGGTGTVGTTTVNGGTLAPGNSIGTLTVQGNLVLSTAATYLVEVSPATSDRTNVTGSAALAGTLRVVASPGSYLKNTYTILSAAGGRTGAFDTVNAGGFLAELSYTPTDVLLSLTASLSSNPLPRNPANVARAIDTFFNNGGVLPPNFVTLFGLTGAPLNTALSQLTGEVNAGASGPAFQSTQSFLGLMLNPFAGGAGGSGGFLFGNGGNGGAGGAGGSGGVLFGTGGRGGAGSDASTAPGGAGGSGGVLFGTGGSGGAGSGASNAPGAGSNPGGAGGAGGNAGSLGTGGAGGNPGSTLRFAADAPTSMPADIALAYARAMPVKARPMVYEPRWSMWGSAYGGTAQVDGNAGIGSTTTDSRVGGFAAGADYRLSRDTVLGFALAGGGTSWSLANGLGSGRSDVFQAGVYGAHRFGPAYLSAALAYAWHDTTTTRTVAIGAETLEGRFSPHVLAGRIEGGYRFGWMSIGVTPYAAAQVQSFRAPGYREVATAGAGTFALSYAGQTETATRTELGVWADHRSWLNPGTALVLRGRVAWAHDFDTDRRIAPTFLALPGASFTTDGASASPDLALLSAVAELRLRGGISLSAKFDGEFGSRSESYAATGTFRYSW